MAKKRIYVWIKFGPLRIYEGHHSVAVGNKSTGFSVFSSKNHVKIDLNNGVSFPDTAGYVGVFSTKKIASSLVKSIDEGFAKKNENTVFTLTGGEDDPAFDAFSQSDPSTGGSILVYQKGDTEGETHERAHLIMGHLRRGHSVSKKRDLRSGIKEEKEAVKVQIGLLKERGEYTKEIRKDIIRHLSTYMRGTTIQRLRTARTYVRSVE